jgi:hypothetical protein
LRSGAEIFGVQGTCYGRVCGAFDDGATVSEDGDLMRGNAELEQETVLANARDGCRQTIFKGGKIESALTLVNLHGIAPTQGDVGLCFTA